MATKRNTTNFAMDEAKPRTTRRPGKKQDTEKDQVQRPKKTDMTFALAKEYPIEDRRSGSTIMINPTAVQDALKQLLESGAFDLLTQNVSMARTLMQNDPDAKGNAIVGFIKDFDFDAADPTVTLTIYGASVAPVQDLGNTGTKLRLEPRLVCNQGEFKCFNGFFLVEDK